MDGLQHRVGRGGEQTAPRYVVALIPDAGDGKWGAAVGREEVPVDRPVPLEKRTSRLIPLFATVPACFPSRLMITWKNPSISMSNW